MFAHFCGRAKEYTVYRNLENCFRWDDRYSNNFLPWVPPLTDSLTKQSNTWNKTKQSNRCIHSCSLYSRRDCGKKCWLVYTKTPTALRHSFTHYIKCNLSFRTVVTKIFIISSKNLKKNQPTNQPTKTPFCRMSRVSFKIPNPQFLQLALEVLSSRFHLGPL